MKRIEILALLSLSLSSCSEYFIAAEKVAGNICQGLAVKLGKAFIYDNRDIDVNEISYISQQCEIALQNISELGLTEVKNNIIAKYNGNEQ